MKKVALGSLDLTPTKTLEDTIKSKGGRPSKSKEDKASNRVLLYFSDEELSLLNRYAKTNGMTDGRFCKMLIMRELNKTTV